MLDPTTNKTPDYVCPDCKLACFVEEYGNAGANDDEAIHCTKCGKRLGTFGTTAFTRKHWKQL
jgi:hypothetical protein